MTEFERTAEIINEKYGYVNNKMITLYGIPKRENEKFGGIEEFCRKNGYKYIAPYLVRNGYKALVAAMECNDKYGYINSAIMEKEFGIKKSYYLFFGGIKNICKRYSLTYRCALRYFSEDIADAAMKFYEKHGCIDLDSFKKESGYSSCAIKSAFGTFNNMLDSLNIPVNIRHHYDKEEVISDIKRVITEYQDTSCTVYRKYGKYSESVINGAFGSWKNAVESLGYNSVRKRYGKERMISELKDLYLEFGVISTPIIRARCEYTYEAASYIFGGREGIYKAIGASDMSSVNKSAGHIQIRKALKNILGERKFYEEKTFKWLRNPSTGKLLYLDFYIPSLRVAIEYQGEQHEKYTPWFHKTYEDFVAAKERDEIKKEICKKHHIKILYIFHNEKVTGEFVENKLTKIKAQ